MRLDNNKNSWKNNLFEYSMKMLCYQIMEVHNIMEILLFLLVIRIRTIWKGERVKERTIGSKKDVCIAILIDHGDKRSIQQSK